MKRTPEELAYHRDRMRMYRDPVMRRLLRALRAARAQPERKLERNRLRRKLRRMLVTAEQHRQWNRERMRQLRASGWGDTEKVRRSERNAVEKALRSRQDGLPCCFNPECSRPGKLEIERGFIVNNQVEIRRVKYCGVC